MFYLYHKLGSGNHSAESSPQPLPTVTSSRKRSFLSTNTTSRSFSSGSSSYTLEEMFSSSSSQYFTHAKSPNRTFGEYMSHVFEEEDVTVDPRLINWQRWIEMRKRLYEKIKESTGRTPPMLVMNSSLDTRYINEEKHVLQQAKAFIKPDKYRGSPYDYLTPILLSNKGNPDLPDCEVTRTNLEKGIIVPATCVGMPRVIREERSLTGPTERPSLKDKWDKSVYVQMKQYVEGHEVSNVRKHKPKTELIMKGQSIEQRIQQNLASAAPVVTVSDVSDMSEDEEESTSMDRPFPCQEQDFSSVRLKVRNTLFYRVPITATHSSSGMLSYVHEGDYNFNYTFSATVKEKSIQYLRLENTGSVKLTYYWCQISETDNEKMPLRPSTFFSHFYFNRGRSIILPGKIDIIPIWFYSKHHGMFQEYWNMVITPMVTEKGVIPFRFWGIATEEPMTLAGISRIESYLNRRVGETAVRRAEEELFIRYNHPDPPPEGAKVRFLDEKYFLLKNPKYFFHPSVVARLTELYREVVDNPDAEWNFDIKCLRVLIIKDTSDLQVQEKRLQVLCENMKLLLQPCVTPVQLDYKLCSVRDILGNLANNIEKDAENLKLKHVFKIVSSVPTSTRSVAVTPKSSSERLRRASSTGGARPKRKNAETRSKQGLTSRKSSSLQLTGQESFLIDERKYAMYKEALFVKVYSHLGAAVEQISAVLDSINATK